MTDKQARHTFGPALPPSPWRLDDVPAPIIDSIVDTLATTSVATYPEVYPVLSRFFSKEDERAYRPVPLSSELDAASQVNKTFRQNIFSRKIAGFLELATLNQVERAEECLTVETRHYVRYVSFPPSTRRDQSEGQQPWTYEFDRLLKTLPNVKNISDECLRLAYCRVPLPTSLERIDMHITGVQTPTSLPIAHLKKLHIACPGFQRKEEDHPDNLETVMMWNGFIKKLCRNLQSLSTLQLTLPGLSTCGCTHKHAGLIGFRDLLLDFPCPLKALRLNVPTCCIDPGSIREAQWNGYLGWLSRSTGSFEHLTIHFSWKMSFLRGPGVSPDEILESLGLDIDSKTGKQTGRQASPEFYLFIQLVFDRVPALKTVHLVYTADGDGESAQIPYKSIKIVRPQAGETIKFEQQMHNGVGPFIQKILDAVESGRFIPPMPHGFAPSDWRQIVTNFEASTGLSFPTGVFPRG